MNIQSLNTSTGDPPNLASLRSYSSADLKLTYGSNTTGTTLVWPTGVIIYGDPPTTVPGTTWWPPKPYEPWAPQPSEPWQPSPTPWVPQPIPVPPFEPTPETMKVLEQLIEQFKKAKEVQEVAPAEKKEAAPPEKEEAPIDDSLEEVDVERFRRM